MIIKHSLLGTEQEIFIAEGKGSVKTGKKNIPVQQNDAIFIQRGEEHSSTNNSNRLLRFIRVIPI